MRSQEQTLYDVVYILKSSKEPTDELKYSLRSVEKNFPHRKVWFFGAGRKDLQPDEFVFVQQEGETKWEKVTNTIRMICEDDRITENFWLFNDDFFIMKETDDLPPVVVGTLWHRARDIELRKLRNTRYAEQLRMTARALRDAGLDRLDYAAHTPLLVNREKAVEAISAFPGQHMFRSIYGNYARIGGVIMDDVKIFDLSQKPTGKERLLSTSDESFTSGEAGKYIRGKFRRKSRFERGKDEISDSK